MSIENIIVHEVRKEEEQVNTVLHTRDEENEVDTHAEQLTSELSNLFRKTGLNTGQFSRPESENDPEAHFVTILRENFIDQSFSGFVEFTKAATREFKRKLDQSSSSKGGYLWFNHYTHNAEHFLSVVLLRKNKG